MSCWLGNPVVERQQQLHGWSTHWHRPITPVSERVEFYRAQGAFLNFIHGRWVKSWKCVPWSTAPVLLLPNFWGSSFCLWKPRLITAWDPPQHRYGDSADESWTPDRQARDVLSGGEKAACGHCLRVCHAAKYLCSDEPTSNLDSAGINHWNRRFINWKRRTTSLLIAASSYLARRPRRSICLYGAGTHIRAYILLQKWKPCQMASGKDDGAASSWSDSYLLVRVQETGCSSDSGGAYFLPPGKTVIWEGLSLSAPCGQITAVTGHNGVGKTTMGLTLSGLMPFQGGCVYIGGTKLSGRKLRQHVYYCSNDTGTQFLPTALEELLLDKTHGKKSVSCVRYSRTNEASLWRGYSSGQTLRRTATAFGRGLCVAFREEYSHFDEPTSGLDGRNMRLIAAELEARPPKWGKRFWSSPRWEPINTCCHGRICIADADAKWARQQTNSRMRLLLWQYTNAGISQKLTPVLRKMLETGKQIILRKMHRKYMNSLCRKHRGTQSITHAYQKQHLSGNRRFLAMLKEDIDRESAAEPYTYYEKRNEDRLEMPFVPFLKFLDYTGLYHAFYANDKEIFWRDSGFGQNGSVPTRKKCSLICWYALIRIFASGIWLSWNCPKLCRADDICYGNMHSKLHWGRTKTLGLGGDCCDFRLTIRWVLWWSGFLQYYFYFVSCIIYVCYGFCKWDSICHTIDLVAEKYIGEKVPSYVLFPRAETLFSQKAMDFQASNRQVYESETTVCLSGDPFLKHYMGHACSWRRGKWI